MTEITSVNDETFESEVLKADQPVLVDFWATWCGPCKMIDPLVRQIADEHEDIKVVKLSVEEAQQVPRTYAVRNIPTLMIFKNGEVAGTQVGAVTKGQLEKFVEQHT